jgi:hypothetical protein
MCGLAGVAMKRATQALLQARPDTTYESPARKGEAMTDQIDRARTKLETVS